MRIYRTTRPAFTLTELLVTMLISLTIMAIALPLVKFNLDESRVREASRQLNAMFAKAKAQAALAGRPVGIMFLRDQNDTNRCRQFLLAEVPAPFGGTTVDSKCYAQFDSTQNRFVLTFASPAGFTPPSIVDDTLIVRDLVRLADPVIPPVPPPAIPNSKKSVPFGIQFDYKGPIHIATYNPTTGMSGLPEFMLPSTNSQLIPSPNHSATPPTASAHAFQIYRLPTAVNTQPLDLARGTYIALDQSGLGGAGTEFAVGTAPVAVMMSPSGHVSSYYVNGSPMSPTATVHFLVVRERNAATSTNPMTDLNNPLNDPTNLWVSVGHLSGAVTTSDNQPGASPRYYAQRHDVRGGR